MSLHSYHPSVRTPFILSVKKKTYFHIIIIQSIIAGRVYLGKNMLLRERSFNCIESTLVDFSALPEHLNIKNCYLSFLTESEQC